MIEKINNGKKGQIFLNGEYQIIYEDTSPTKR